MSAKIIQGDAPSSHLMAVMGADDIVPGAEPSYQVCKLIYLYHPLGSKMVDSPIKLAMSLPRDITVSDSPGEDVAEAFFDEWKRMRCDDIVKQHAQVARTYGLGTIILGCVGKPPGRPLKPEDLYEKSIYLNVVDPLNTAGSVSMDQDPNSPTFQKWRDVRVGEMVYHRSRACVLMNEAPVYIAWSSSAFSYTGRSVYQRVLFPLKSFIWTMKTNDMVAKKAGLLIAKINPVGAIVDNIMAMFAGFKRAMIQEGVVEGVLSINTGNGVMEAETIESLNLMNIDGAGGWARTNILKDIATGGDMPAWFLENETLVSGFGEGEQDAENILRYIDGIREWLQPTYDFLDPVVQQRAWCPAFFEIMRSRYPSIYGKMTYATAFAKWRNSFSAMWPALRKEPPSKAVETEKVKLEGVVSIVETFMPLVDPETGAKVLAWAADAINENKTMFPSPLVIDADLIEDHLVTKQKQAEDAAAAGAAAGAGEDDDTEPKPATMELKDSAELLRLDDWREGDHPRDNDGKFGSGGGAGGSASPISHINTSHLPSPRAIRNTFHSWSEAEKKGDAGRAELAAALQKVAAKVGLSDDIQAPEDLKAEHESNGKSYVFLGPNKSKEKVTSKVTNDYDGNWDMLKDMVRATIAVEHPDQIKEAVDQLLANGIEFAAQPKDTISAPTGAGYRDINTLIRLPNGMLAELQFNVKSMVVAKQAAHALYDEQIRLEHKHGRDKEKWPAGAAREYEDLGAAQQAIYNPAWERASKRERPSSTELQLRKSPRPSPASSGRRPGRG